MTAAIQIESSISGPVEMFLGFVIVVLGGVGLYLMHQGTQKQQQDVWRTGRRLIAIAGVAVLPFVTLGLSMIGNGSSDSPSRTSDTPGRIVDSDSFSTWSDCMSADGTTIDDCSGLPGDPSDL